MAAGTTALTTVDQRSDSTDRHPVWEHIIVATWASGDSDDVTRTIPMNGIIQKIIVNNNNNSNGVTSQLQINDGGDFEIFDTGELAETTTTPFSVTEPVAGDIDFVFSISADPGASTGITTARIRGI